MALIVPLETTDVAGHLSVCEEPVANRGNNQIADQCIGARQFLSDTTPVRAVGNIQFCRDLLTCERNQAIVTDIPCQDRL